MRKKRVKEIPSNLQKPFRELHHHTNSFEEQNDLMYFLQNHSDILHEPFARVVPSNTSDFTWEATGDGDVETTDWNEYYRLKRMRPTRVSDEAEELREIRKNLRLTTDPLVVRQWLYRALVMKICGYYD